MGNSRRRYRRYLLFCGLRPLICAVMRTKGYSETEIRTKLGMRRNAYRIDMRCGAIVMETISRHRFHVFRLDLKTLTTYAQMRSAVRTVEAELRKGIRYLPQLWVQEHALNTTRSLRVMHNGKWIAYHGDRAEQLKEMLALCDTHTTLADAKDPQVPYFAFAKEALALPWNYQSSTIPYFITVRHNKILQARKSASCLDDICRVTGLCRYTVGTVLTKLGKSFKKGQGERSKASRSLRNKHIYADYKRVGSITALTRKYKLTRTSIRNILNKEFGKPLPPLPKGRSSIEANRKRIITLNQAGHSRKYIREKLGVSSYAIIRTLRLDHPSGERQELKQKCATLLWELGYSLTSIANILRLTSDTVRVMLGPLYKCPSVRYADKKKRCEKLLRTGMSVDMVAKELNISRHLVRTVFANKISKTLSCRNFRKRVLVRVSQPRL